AVDYALLGVALAETGDVEHAISALDQAAKMNPSDAAVAYNLGLLYRKAGRDPEAATCLQHALSLRPDYDAARRALEAVRQAGEAVTQMPVAGPQPFGTP